jgi:photosystem II stability/assembly factor-like uncharacterized protein
VYASTRGVSNNGNPPWHGIIYKSTDGGQSWAPSLQGLGGSGLEDWAYSLCINPSQAGQVFAALHESGPYLLNDSGWHSIHTGIRDYSGRSIVISTKDTSILYLGVWHDDAVYQTLNSGDQWIMANHDLLNVMVYSLALDPYDVNIVYVASYNNGVLKTIDAGSNWLFSGLFTDKLYAIVINPTLTNNLFAGTSGDGLYRSIDFSTSWERSDMGIDNSMVTSIIQVPTYPYPLFSSVYGAGVYQSEYRGQAWSQMNTGLEDQFVHDLVVDPLNSKLLYALTDTGGLFKNDLTSGNGWVNTGQGLPVTNYPTQAYSADDPFATLDMQENMPISPTGTSVSQTSMVGLLTMVFAPSDPDDVYIGTVDKGVYRSLDNGTSWIPVGLGGNNIRSIAVDPTDPALVYATTDYYGSLKYSTDGGDSWKDANLQANFYSVATSTFKSGTVYVGTSSGIYNYNHQSDTWTALGLSGQTVTSVAVDINHPGVLFAGTTNGAYYTKDNGITWIYVDNQLSGQTILSISFDKTDPQLVYFSTKTHGIYLATIRN